jgi:GTPase SAR1 family protein
MPQAACPFCFRRVETGKLAYQCTGRGAKKCTKKEDALRVQMTGNHAETYPTFAAPTERFREPLCPTCGWAARRRACPACHTALPIGFVDSESPMIGLIGSKGSGKTVLMTVLVKQLRETVAKQFGASIRLTTDSPDGHAGVEAYKTYREDALFQDGNLPTGTVAATAENRRIPLVVEWQGTRNGAFGRSSVKSTILSFLDTSGEQLNTLEETYSLEYIAACDSLMIALDPFARPGARSRLNLPQDAIQTTDGTPLQVVEHVTEMLRVELGVKNKKKIKVPVAVVFTKIDAFYRTMDRGNPIMNPPGRLPAYQETHGQAVHEQMRALLHDWNGSDIDFHLSLNYQNFRFFGVSALGAEPDYSRHQAAPGGIRPHLVEDPLLWLLTREGTVRTQ